MNHPTVQIVGNEYRFRRHQAHFASIEALNRRLARGWIAHDHTAGDVEVYKIQPGAPGYINEISHASFARIDTAMNDAADAAIREDWTAYRAVVEDLADSIALTGTGRAGWVHVVRWIERTVTERTDNPMAAERMRQGLIEARTDGARR
jgi:hypothetical protein